MLLSWPEKSSSGLKACIGDDVYDTDFILLLGVSSLALIASLRISDIVAFEPSIVLGWHHWYDFTVCFG